MERLLAPHPQYCNDEGALIKNAIVEAALAMRGDLIRLLLSHEGLKANFFSDVDGITVFDKVRFQKFVMNKRFLPDSYTSYKNKIGLTGDDGDFLSESREVVLSWPYKDCVLEGGQTQDDARRNEVFWNEILAPDQINRLVEPKVLTGFSRHDANGEHNVESVLPEDNLIIKGNNLLALHSLKSKYSGKIKLIYIDPPYNTGSRADTFVYNNTFKRTSWLTFMRNRLEVAKQLLTPDGCLIVAIDENEHAYLGVLLREIFPEYEIHNITIIHNPRGVQGTNFSYTNEYSYFVIPEGKKSIINRKIDAGEIEWSNLRNWGSESERSDAKNCFYPIVVNPKTLEITGFGDVSNDDFHPKAINEIVDGAVLVYPVDSGGVERKWRYARQSVEEIKHLLKARIKSGVVDIEIGKDFGQYKTVWTDPRYDANEYGTKIVKSLVPNCPFSFPKSLYNVYDCLYAVVGNDKEATILDFFGGSGTTAHAVLELNKQDGGNRKFILCEQMDYVETVTRTRVAKVIENNKQGSFVYCELAKANQTFVDEILAATDKKALSAIWEQMQKTGFLSWKIDPKTIDKNACDFESLSVDNTKKFLIEALDKNLLYMPLSEIENKEYEISESDKLLNKQFYGKA